MNRPPKQPCRAVTRTGQPCQTAAGASGYCFTHDPERAAERTQARRKGGLLRLASRRTETPDSVPAQVRDMNAVLRVLDFALSETVTLENSVNRNKLLAALAHGYTAALQTSELETRLAALEPCWQAVTNSRE